MQNKNNLDKQGFADIVLSTKKWSLFTISFEIIIFALVLLFFYYIGFINKSLLDDIDTILFILIQIAFWSSAIIYSIFIYFLKNKALLNYENLKKEKQGEWNNKIDTHCSGCNKLIVINDYKDVDDKEIKPISITIIMKVYYCKSCYKKYNLKYRQIVVDLILLFWIIFLMYFFLSFNVYLNELNSYMLIFLISFMTIIIPFGYILSILKFKKLYT